MSRTELYWILGLTLVAAVLRFHNLGEWSIFSDEVNTMVESRDFSFFSPSQSSNRWTTATNSLNHFFTGFAYTLFGESLFTARLFPALFGIAALPVFYLLIRRLFNPRVALLTVLFMAFSPNLIFLSGYARYNSMLVFFGGISFLFLLHGLVHQSLRSVAAGTALLVLAIFTHTTAVLIAVVIFPWILLSLMLNRERRKHYCWSLVIFVSPFLLLLFWVGGEFLWMAKVITRDFMGSGRGYPPHRVVASVVYNDGLVLSILTLVAFYRTVTDRRKEHVALLLYWSIPLILITVGAKWFTVGPRYLHSVLPGFYMLAALGTEEWIVVLDRRSRWAKVFLVIFILVSQAPLIASNWSDGGRYDTNAAARYLVEQLEDKSDVLVLAESHMTYNYLSRGKLEAEELPYHLKDLLERLHQESSAFLVFPLQRGVPLGIHGSEYRMWINRNCILLKLFTKQRFDFMRYEVAVYRYLGTEGN